MQVDWYYHLLIDSIKVNDWDFLPILRSIKWEIDSNWYPKKIPLPSISLDLHVNYPRFSDDWKTQLNTNIPILNLNELSILKVLIIYKKINIFKHTKTSGRKQVVFWKFIYEELQKTKIKNYKYGQIQMNSVTSKVIL